MTFWETVAANFVGTLFVGLGAFAAGTVWWFWTQRRALHVNIESRGNTVTTDPTMRWYHAQVSCQSDGALYPTLEVLAPGREAYEAWFFAEYLSGKPQPTALRRSRLLVPIVWGKVDGSHNSWHLTPNGQVSSVGLPFAPNADYRFCVRVSWLRGGARQEHKEAEFRLLLGPTVTDEPTFERIERRWRAAHRLRRAAR